MNNLNRISAILALIIGVLAIAAGGTVLLGRNPGYYVIGWVPVYNFLLGAVSILFAFLIWRKQVWALPASILILVLHTIVQLILKIAYQNVVAVESIAAMTTRIVVWIVIVALQVIHRRQPTLDGRKPTSP